MTASPKEAGIGEAAAEAEYAVRHSEILRGVNEGRKRSMDADRLNAIPVFADLDDGARDAIAKLAAEVSVPEGKELVREGDYSYDLIAIEEGTARVHHDEQTIAELGPGDVVGEMGVLERTQRSASVTATSPMRLVTLTGWDVRKLRRQAPEAVERLQELVAQRRM
jgi:CRP/FNR family transcriptional regulator, cyclic AMP receptor protein